MEPHGVPTIQQEVLACRLGVIFMVGMVARFKFYFAWAISEASLIMSGFCFNGFTDQAWFFPSDEQCLSRSHDQNTISPKSECWPGKAV